MILKILFALCVALEFVFVPLFLKYSWPKKCWTSFCLKMVCSALFFFAGLLAIKISGNTSSYAWMILWGLALGWAGDLFLHLITEKMWVFGIGLFAFLGGHIFYIVAFQKALDAMSLGTAPLFIWQEIAAVVCVLALFAVYAVKKKIKQKLYMIIPVVLYAVTISTMLAKAFRLCIENALTWDYAETWPLFLTVALGAVLFILSDATLGMILFAGHEKNRPLKWFNIGTYFAAQILLGCSIFFLTTAPAAG